MCVCVCVCVRVRVNNLYVIKSFFLQSCVVHLFFNPIHGQMVGSNTSVVRKQSTEWMARQHNDCFEGRDVSTSAAAFAWGQTK